MWMRQLDWNFGKRSRLSRKVYLWVANLLAHIYAHTDTQKHTHAPTSSHTHKHTHTYAHKSRHAHKPTHTSSWQNSLCVGVCMLHCQRLLILTHMQKFAWPHHIYCSTNTLLSLSLPCSAPFLSLSLSPYLFPYLSHANKAEQAFHGLMTSAACNLVIDPHQLPLGCGPLYSRFLLFYSFTESVICFFSFFLCPLNCPSWHVWHEHSHIYFSC